MTELEFLSPDRAGPHAVWRSPLERALRDAPPGIDDLSRTGKLEVRGDVRELRPDGAEVVAVTPEKALVLCPYDRTAELRAELRRDFRAVVDLTGALAGLRLRGEQLMRRLSDLDLDSLPAVGPVAHVQTYVLRDAESFRLFFPQEYADHVAEVVLDASEGLL